MPRLRYVLCAFISLLAAMDSGAEALESGLLRVQYPEGGEALGQRSLAILESALEDFSAALEPGDEPIEVIICGTHAEFAYYAGDYAQARVGGIAVSEEGIIVVKAPGLQLQPARYGDILRHELAHVMLARTVDVANVPRWFNEGIAMTLAEEYRWYSVFHTARMYLQGGTMTYRELQIVMEFAQDHQFGDAYAQSLSMTRFLKRRLGEEAFWSFVREQEERPFARILDDYTGWTPHEFVEAWRRSLWQVALVSSIVSGFTAFQFMAFLTFAAYMRKKRQGEARIRQWELEEQEDEDPEFLTWDDVVEPEPEPWAEPDDDEEWR